MVVWRSDGFGGRYAVYTGADAQAARIDSTLRRPLRMPPPAAPVEFPARVVRSLALAPARPADGDGPAVDPALWHSLLIVLLVSVVVGALAWQIALRWQSRSDTRFVR